MAKQRKVENIVVICAHPDDQVLGVGGTIAKYAEEGKRVYTLIFSYGEGSHPWLKKKVTADMRRQECLEADNVLGGKGVSYLALEESRFKGDVDVVVGRIVRFLSAKRPSKVFTHSPDDAHTDHRAVYDVVMSAVGCLTFKTDVYVFEVWNPVNLMKRHAPKMYVDVSSTFGRKIEALRCFRSQVVSIMQLIFGVYAGAFLNGLHSGSKLAEVFYKVK